MSKKKLTSNVVVDEKITKSIQEIMQQKSSEPVITPEEPKQKVYSSWGKKQKK